MHNWYCWFAWIGGGTAAHTRQRTQQTDYSRPGMGNCWSDFNARTYAVGGRTWRWIQLDVHSEMPRIEHFLGNSDGGGNRIYCWAFLQQFIRSCYLFFLQIQHLTTATLIWLFTRHDLNIKYKPIVTLLLIATPFKVLWLDAVLKTVISGLWSLLAFKALATCSIGVLTLHIYADLAQTIGL